MRSLFNIGTLNIFTDASVKSKADGNYISCYGAVCVVTNQDGSTTVIEEQYEVMDNATNNRGELCGIYLGLLLAIKYRNQFNRINILSDSQFSIFSLTKWIYGWVRHIKDNMYISSSDAEVANQDMIKLIINTVLLNNIHVNFYHQKGHANTNKMIKKARQVFYNSNGIWLDDFELKSVCYYNDRVDIYTGYKLNEIPVDYKVAINYNAQFNVQKYKNLINNG